MPRVSAVSSAESPGGLDAPAIDLAGQPTDREWHVLAVVAFGGALGALGRHGIERVLPIAAGGFPLATFTANLLGCLVIGAAAGWVLRPGVHRLLRPFVATGVLGGFTTFSTYTVQVLTAALHSRVDVAAGYLLATLFGALLAVEIGFVVSRARARRRPGSGRR